MVAIATSNEDEFGGGDSAQSLVAGTAPRSAYAGLLRNRNYRLWFASALASSLGDWTGLVALQTLVVALSADAGQPRLQLFALGGIMMARLLPSLLMGPVAGVLADRYDRKRLMVFTDLARGGLFVLIAFSGDLIALFTLTFIVECLSLLFLSAKDSSLPTIVDKRHLTEANQLNLLVTYGTLPFGAVLATAMVAVASLLRNLGLDVDPTVLALLVNSGTFFVAAALLRRLRLPAHGRRAEPGQKQGVWSELREGLQFIRDLPVIRALIIGVVGVFFGAGAVVTLGPAFVGTTLGRPETDWFTLMTLVGAGLVVGILAVPILVRRVSKERAFAVSLVLTAACAVWVALQQTFAATLGVGFLLGGVAGFSFVLGYTLLQEHTRDDIRARTFAAFYTATRTAMFASLGLAPFLAGTIGRTTLIVGGGQLTMSGTRITIVLAGLVGLISAATSGRAMWKAAGRIDRPVNLAARNNPHGGLFITFEGVEGAGKSTQVRALADTLRAEGRDVVITREPGGPPVAERVRQLLLDPDTGDMEARTEALLYAAARAEHVARVVRPALEQGKVVICDRFIDSSLAYQAYARGLGEEDIAEINRWATGGLIADAVVLLNLDPEEGLRRVGERARGVDAGLAQGDGDHGGDRLEREQLAFHQRVGAGYLALAKADRRRFLVLDASGDPETIARQVRIGLHTWLPMPVEQREGDKR